MLTVERVETLRGREDLQQPWRDLLARSPQRNLFLTPEWIATWWEHFGAGRELWLLVVREGDRMVGLAPMTVTREFDGRMPARVLGFMRNRHMSRGDFIIPERRGEVVTALVAYWRGQARDWDVLRLQDVPEESGSLRAVEEALGGTGLDPLPAATRRTLDYLPLQGTWEDYVRGRSHGFRRNLRRERDAMERAGEVEFVRACAPEDVARSMAWLFDLEARSWKAGAATTAFAARDRAFHVALAARFSARGGVENRFLRLDGTGIAGLQSFLYDGVLTMVLTYYDPAFRALSPGRNLVGRAVSDAWREGSVREIDFNGTSPFLRRWTGRTRPLGVLYAHNRRLYSQLILGLKRARRLLLPGAPRGSTRPAPRPAGGVDA